MDVSGRNLRDCWSVTANVQSLHCHEYLATKMWRVPTIPVKSVGPFCFKRLPFRLLMFLHCQARWLILSGFSPKLWDPKYYKYCSCGISARSWLELFFLENTWKKHIFFRRFLCGISAQPNPSRASYRVPKRQHLLVSSQRGAGEASGAGHVCQNLGSTS